MKSIFFFFFLLINLSVFSQSRFFKQHWVEYEGRINNNKQVGERTRVNEHGMSTVKTWYNRFESQVNGLALLNISDTTLQIERAEMVFEMWGGHPKTENKRFSINGSKYYPLPSENTQAGHCEYQYPIVPVDYHDLVSGYNAIQFLCDRGESFWGHFILEQIGINVFLKSDAPELIKSGLVDFRAIPSISNKVMADEVTFGLDYPLRFTDQIEAVHFYAFYLGYNDSGAETDEQWHGFLKGRKYCGHLGTVSQIPYQVKWNTSMIPDQGKPMAVKALIQFKNGMYYQSDILTGLSFPHSRPHVQLYHCIELPRPFWSRDNQLRTALIELPEDLSEIESVELHVRNWDGGEGNIKDPFMLNGVPYKITAGDAPHELIYTINKVDPKNLKPGVNEIQLISDTKHHGIELCLPGPCLIVKYKK